MNSAALRFIPKEDLAAEGYAEYEALFADEEQAAGEPPPAAPVHSRWPRAGTMPAMGSYRNEDEALIGLARQLTDAYGEARPREDQDFACDAIAEFLSEYRASAPSEALLAILDLPLTTETYPAGGRGADDLADRGPGRRRVAARGGAW